MLFTETAGAVILSENLDPVSFLVLHSDETAEDGNTIAAVETPNAPLALEQQPPVQAANSQSVRQGQLQIASDSLVAASVNPDVGADENILQDDPPITVNPGNQLQRARITVPKSENGNESKNELQRIIEQICNVEFVPKGQSPKPFIVVEPLTATEPNGTLSGPGFAASEIEASEALEGKEEYPTQAATLPYEPVSAQTLQMLDDLSQHPEQLNNPFELGEVLFLSGQLKRAAVFYQQALNCIDPDEAGSAEDRAWILFQTANCLREDEPQKAMKMYKQLITEYPESAWTELAKSREKLIDWYQDNKPGELIAKNQLKITNGASLK